MRKLFSVALTCVIAAGVIACGNRAAEEAAETGAAAESVVTPERPSDVDLVALDRKSVV